MRIENNLSTKVNEMENIVKEILKIAGEKANAIDVIRSADPETIIIMQKALELYDISIDYLKAEATMLEDINTKLDLLLESK